MIEKKDRVKNKGGQPPGEKHPRAKLKDSEILKMRKMLDDGAKVVIVAFMFNVTHQHVSNIRTRKRRKNI